MKTQAKLIAYEVSKMFSGDKGDDAYENAGPREPHSWQDDPYADAATEVW